LFNKIIFPHGVKGKSGADEKYLLATRGMKPPAILPVFRRNNFLQNNTIPTVAISDDLLK